MKTNHRTQQVISMLMLLFFVHGSILANDPNIIPDYVNYQKYHKIFQDKKNISDPKRANASSLKANAQHIDQDIQNKESTKAQNEDTIADSHHSISDLTNDIDRLESENTTHAFVIQSNHQTMSSNNQKIDGLNLQIIDLDREIQGATEVYNAYLTSERRISDRLGRIGQDIRSFQHQIKENKRQLHGAQDGLANTHTEIQNNRAKIQELKDLRPVKVQELADAQAKEQQILQNINRMNRNIASLPAEIETLKASKTAALNSLNQAKASQNAIQQTINQIDADLQTIGQIAAIEAEISALKVKKFDLEAEKTSLQARINEIAVAITANQALIVGHNQRLAQITTNKANVEQKIAQANAEKAALVAGTDPDKAAKIVAVEGKIALLTQKLGTMQQRIDKNTQAVTTLNAANQTLTQEQNQKSRKIDGIDGRIADLPNKIANKETRKTTLQNKMANPNSTAQSLNQEKNAANASLTSAQQNVATAQKTLDDLTALIKTKRDNLNDLQTQRLPQAQQNLAATQQIIQKRTNRINQIDQNIPKLRHRNQTLRQSIPGQEENIRIIVADINMQENNLNDLFNKERDVAAQLRNIQAQIKSQGEDVRALENDQAELHRRVQNLYNHNRDLTEDNRSRSITIQDNQSTIANEKSEIIRLNNLIERLTADNQELSRVLPGLYADSKAAWQAFDVADTDAKAAEQVTAEKYAKYVEIRANYDRQDLAAKNSGTKQGQANGNTDGDQPGTDAGTASGEQEGDVAGTDEGKLFGFRKGLADGMADGQREGYKHGLEAPTNYKEGYAKGWKKGKDNAKVYAHRSEYPRGRKDKKEELLNTQPSDEVELENGASNGYSNVSDRKVNASPISMEGSEYEPEDSDEANDMAYSATEQEIANLQKKIDRIPTEATFNMGSLTVKVTIDIDQADCQADYIDFINTCSSAYKEAYTTAYVASYKRAYRSAKTSAYKTAKAIAFDLHKSDRWQTGHEQSYPLAFNKFDDIGAEEANHKGYQTGKTKGYEENIAEFQNEFYANGESDEEKYFAVNPVLRLVDANIKKARETTEDGKYIAGDDLLINVKIANFGRKDSQKGQATIQLEAVTDNVTVDGRVHNLTSIPSQTVAMVQAAAAAKIKPYAVLPQDVKIRVIAKLPDGEINTQIITIRTKLHMTADIKISMETNPKAEGILHAWVTVTNTSPVDAKDYDFEVVMTLPNGNVRGVRLKQTQSNLGKLKSGQKVSSIKFYSYIDSDAAEKKVPFLFTVKYGPAIIAQETVKVEFKGGCRWGDWSCNNDD